MVAAYLAGTWGAGNQSAFSLEAQRVGNGDSYGVRALSRGLVLVGRGSKWEGPL